MTRVTTSGGQGQAGPALGRTRQAWKVSNSPHLCERNGKSMPLSQDAPTVKAIGQASPHLPPLPRRREKASSPTFSLGKDTWLSGREGGEVLRQDGPLVSRPTRRMVASVVFLSLFTYL